MKGREGKGGMTQGDAIIEPRYQGRGKGLGRNRTEILGKVREGNEGKVRKGKISAG